MANMEQLAIIKQGPAVWNTWRKQNSAVPLDFHYARLKGANLVDADLSGAYLRRADLAETHLRGAQLGGANLSWSDLDHADLRGADLRHATLRGADLRDADLRRADLRGASLHYAVMVRTKLQKALLTECRVHGISAWELELEGSNQENLIISRTGQPSITVDDLEMAQFIYLLLDNRKFRNAIATITSKAVLILGNFAPGRKDVLEAIRTELRNRGYLPILFEFENAANKTLTEMVTTLARLSKFIVADLSEPRSVPDELRAIVPDLAIPVLPLIEVPERPYTGFQDLQLRDYVLPLRRYGSIDDLLKSLDDDIADAESKANDLEARKAKILLSESN